MKKPNKPSKPPNVQRLNRKMQTTKKPYVKQGHETWLKHPKSRKT